MSRVFVQFEDLTQISLFFSVPQMIPVSTLKVIRNFLSFIRGSRIGGSLTAEENEDGGSRSPS